jgi:hypothetical protein
MCSGVFAVSDGAREMKILLGVVFLVLRGVPEFQILVVT